MSFGDPYEKRTCLWLKNLSELQTTNIVDLAPRIKFDSGKTMPAWYSDAWKLSKEEGQKLEAKHFRE